MAAFFLCMFILFKNTKHKFIIHTYNIHMHPYTHKPHTKCTLLQCIQLHTNPAILRKYVRFMCIYIYKPVSQHSGFDTFSFSLILDAISRTMSRVYCITHRPDKYKSGLCTESPLSRIQKPTKIYKTMCVRRNPQPSHIIDVCFRYLKKRAVFVLNMHFHFIEIKFSCQYNRQPENQYECSRRVNKGADRSSDAWL